MSIDRADLHVHLLQSLYPSDVYGLGKADYTRINWNRFGFLDRYEQTIGIRLNPPAMFQRPDPADAVRDIERAMIFPASEAGSFDKFNIRTYFPLCVTGYYLDQNQHDLVVRPILERHRKEGLSYVEYRQGVGYTDEDKEEWKDWHRRFMLALKDASNAEFRAKYIMRITDEMYGAVREFVAENPDLLDVFVGLDFTGEELPAKSHATFFDKLRADNQHEPRRALDIVAHVGEVFFDKSIESAIRWCHEYAASGVTRMAHCIALGLDPAIAASRRPGAHTREPTSERMDQIDYDLKYLPELTDRGIIIDRVRLLEERSALEKRDPREPVLRMYDQDRFSELRIRQDFVLDEVRQLGVVIETCPTSNFLIGGLSTDEHHPFRKFYDSGQRIAICTDDPGIFKRSLSDEVELVCRSFHLDPDELEARIGDPYDYRLGRSRTLVGP